MQTVLLDDGLVIPYIGLKDFITNKKASGRSKDIADIKEIRKGIKSPKPGPEKKIVQK